MNYISLTQEQRELAIRTATRMAKRAIAWRQDSKTKRTHNKKDWTPEPWCLKHGGWTIHAVDEPQERICHTFTHYPVGDEARKQVANGFRIVECVNACAGITYPEKTITAMRDALNEIQVRMRNNEGYCTVLDDMISDALRNK